MGRYNGLRRRTSEQVQFVYLVFLLATTTVYYGFLVEDVHLLIPLGPIGEFWDYTPRIFSQQGVVTIMLTLNVSRNALVLTSSAKQGHRSSLVTGSFGGAPASLGR